MEKLKQYNQSLARRFAEKIKHKRVPKLVYHVKDDIDSEQFACHYAGGVITLEAESPLAAAYGIHQIHVGVSSGHSAEFLGHSKPCFPLRPLWVTCNYDVTIVSRAKSNPSCYAVGLGLPSFLKAPLEISLLEHFCCRLIELGYNSVILGSRDYSFIQATLEERPFDLENVCSIFHSYGLKIILKPHFLSFDNQKIETRSIFNLEYQENIKNSILDFIRKTPWIDYFFWEGEIFQSVNQLPSTSHLTQAEVVKAEIMMIEESIGGLVPLIYYLPAPDLEIATQQANWLSQLCDDIGNTTILAFSALAGSPRADHLPAHPFWEKLRQSPDTSATLLMPIVNIGSVLQGEGFWPALTLDLVDDFYRRCDRHSFAGVIALAGGLPPRGTLIDCNLWVAAQFLWKGRSPALLAKTWFLANRPDVSFEEFFPLLKKVRQIIIQLSYLRSLTHENQRDAMSREECRATLETLLSEIKYLQLQFSKRKKDLTNIPLHNKNKIDRAGYEEYFTYFANDARRIIAYAAQCFNETLPRMMGSDDSQEGFWTQKSLNEGSRGQGKLFFLDHPNRGLDGSRMELIYEENVLF